MTSTPSPTQRRSIVTPNATQGTSIPFTKALLYIKHFVYFHHATLYQYCIQGMFKYMENNQEKYHCHNNASRRFRATQSTWRSQKIWSRSLLHTNRRNGRVTLPGIFILWLQCVIALVKIKCKSNQKLHNILSTNWTSTLWRCIFTDHIGLLSNLLTSTFKLPERVMMDLNQGYQQLNHHEYTFRILQTQASLEVFPESWQQRLQKNAIRMMCL